MRVCFKQSQLLHLVFLKAEEPDAKLKISTMQPCNSAESVGFIT